MDSDDSSSDNSSDKEVAHICLMALGEDKPESSQQREINTEVNNSDSLSIEDYEEAFAKLYEEYKVYKKKCSALNKEIASLRAENDSMSIVVQENKFYKNQMLLYDELNKELEDSKIACEKLIEKNRILETKVESLTNDLAKFTNGTQILDTILGSQRLSNQKSGLGLPKINFEKDHVCKPCSLGKQTKVSFKSKNVISTFRPLELLHLDLFGPITPISLGGKAYTLVIVDDYTRYTWTYFLAHKDDLKSIGTPMSSTIKLEKDEKGKDVDQKLFRGMIGSLLYLTASRPDIHFSVCLCAWFQSCPKESHLIAVKRIFKYLIGTHSIGLWYPKCDTFDLVGYSDSDFAGSRLDRKSTSGSCVAQILWMKQQLEDFGIKVDHVPIRCDNTSAINLTKNPIQHSRSKHIEIRHHFIRDHVQNGDIKLEFVPTEQQLADIFTKPLNEENFCRIRRELGMSEAIE
ncbi:uncharacterized protein LOC131182852 [Hevea brasiliensis]|uniref:uncharacterized protein LOC131182852 n=1 Tax=Hevea brasiliensis TaxID=3981 RepID=UPI0025F59684|nr:uncharacterized protein LOC131182852 [Hevea brasiliensis]